MWSQAGSPVPSGWKRSQGFMEGIKDIMSIPKTRFFIENPNRLRDNARDRQI